MREYTESSHVHACDQLDLVDALVRGIAGEYLVYERDGVWFVGSVPDTEIIVTDERVLLSGGDRPDQSVVWADTPWPAVHDLLCRIPVRGWRLYGWTAFEAAYRERPDDDLARFFVPGVEFEVHPDRIVVRALDGDQAPLVEEIVEAAGRDGGTLVPTTIAGLSVEQTDAQYLDMVQRAVSRIRDGALSKVILSRTVDVPVPIDLRATYVHGRRANSPARSFLVDLGGWGVAGFSPETVVEVDRHGHVSTQPLAGTRRRTGDPDRDRELRADLLADPKEVFEHALSVRLAIDEMSRVASAESVRVDEFMGIAARGSVQHLASRVSGDLAPGRTGWDALAALFPSITAAGIPKAPAFELIAELESERRGLYAGAIVLAEDGGAVEGALVLRAVYQRDGRTWLRAGAGVVGASIPGREHEETCEKLASIAPYLVATSDGATSNDGAVIGDASLAAVLDSVAAALDVPVTEVPFDRNLTDMGVDSVQLMCISSLLRSHGKTITFRDLATEPTVRAWIRLAAMNDVRHVGGRQ